MFVLVFLFFSLAGYVEALASRLGLSIPDLTPKQADMWQTRLSAHLVSILWAALLVWRFLCLNWLINAFCQFFHLFLNDHQFCACSPEGLVLSPCQGESRDRIFLSLSGFFVCSKPQVTSDMASLCSDFVYAVQIPGLGSGYGDNLLGSYGI